MKYLLLSAIFLFIFPCNVFAFDFTCLYKRESDTIKLSMSGDLFTLSEYPMSFSITHNDLIKRTTYPANYIGFYNNEFYLIPDAYYSVLGEKTYTCPKEIYIAYDKNGVIAEESVINQTNGLEGISIVFFSEYGKAIDKETKEITDTEAILEKAIDSNPLSREKYKEIAGDKGIKFKTFFLNMNNSSSPIQEEPTELENDFVYCYYKNDCGAVLELKFYENGNLHYRSFNDGHILNNDWSLSKCPISVTNYKGSESGCTGSNSQKCYQYYKESSTQLVNEITDGTCSENTDSIAVYFPYGSSKTSKILVKDLSGTIYIGQSTFQISNISEFTKELSGDDHMKYPKYIIETSEGYQFSNAKISNARTIYIESVQLYNITIGEDNKEITNTCQIIVGDNFLSFLNNTVFKIIYIGIPIILILLTSFDFAKVVFIDDKEGVKNASKKFGKRIVVSILIYLVPTILIFVSNLIGVNQIDDCIKQLEKLVQEESS